VRDRAVLYYQQLQVAEGEPYPLGAGGEGGHEAAKPDAVIHSVFELHSKASAEVV
jgi:hypothetical protein